MGEEAKFDPIEVARGMEMMETLAEMGAPVVRSYYEAMLDSGFTEEQALALTNTFQTIWWSTLFRRQD